ncbi:MAG TPA: Wzz/FepE/Etk N-terminal domain-containing protein [Streptosporangiaceae bacterium]
MSEQTLDLQRSVQNVRRRKILVGVLTLLGLAGGAAYAGLRPAMLTSTAQVLIPVATVQSANTNGVPDPTGFMNTQAVVATSDPVLSAAQRDIDPPVSLQTLRETVKATVQVQGILAISATSRTAGQAENNANAVSQAYVGYVKSAGNPAHTSASVLNQATNATGAGSTRHLLTFAAIGAVIGALIGIIAALIMSRRDKRLRRRDEMAAAVGLPVLAALPVSHAVDVAGWTKLFAEYEPAAVHAWHLRSALHQLGLTGNTDNGSGSSLTVLSLSSDSGACALGPQLAVFTASLGIPTTLLVGPQPETTITATLRTACEAPPHASAKRPSQLRLVVTDGPDVDVQPSGLTVVVAVVDSQAPQLAHTMHTTATVLGVSAGAATAEQLARVASSAAADGHDITGLLVADPDPADHTTGRIPQLPRPAGRRQPNVTAMSIENRR